MIPTVTFVICSLFVSPRRLHHICDTRHTACLAAPQGEGNDEDPFREDERSGNSDTKSLSPLAMAAADWLEDEDDELALYWDRFDATKRRRSTDDADGGDAAPRPPQPGTASSASSDHDREGATTEQLLDRYHASRGIDKREDEKHAARIKAATASARGAASAEDALRNLEPMRRHLQYNTKVGGTAYFELAQALDASGDATEARGIYERLAASPHAELRRKARALLSQSSRPRRSYTANVWHLFWENWD
jgi:hypothetical protein